MKCFLSILMCICFTFSFGQEAIHVETNNFIGPSAKKFLVHEKNDLIIANPSKRIYQNNQTVYIENDFKRTYKPFSTKNRLENDSFLAKAGGLILIKSSMFIFDRGLKSLLNPRSKKKTLRKLDKKSTKIAKRRTLQDINL